MRLRVCLGLLQFTGWRERLCKQQLLFVYERRRCVFRYERTTTVWFGLECFYFVLAVMQLIYPPLVLVFLMIAFLMCAYFPHFYNGKLSSHGFLIKMMGLTAKFRSPYMVKLPKWIIRHTCIQLKVPCGVCNRCHCGTICFRSVSLYTSAISAEGGISKNENAKVSKWIMGKKMTISKIHKVPLIYSILLFLKIIFCLIRLVVWPSSWPEISSQH